ncbi:hypothetical protein LOC67_26020 [Stieleria sp. JC731]|nr:hypothetical protein [Stieleria sp. JC731]MCC9604025.1 hypothetical protein [Stieleria sp. JC731]
MALPDDLLDELLSAYLDGAASSDECARAEQLIESDSAVAERFESMVDQRSQLRALASQNSQTSYQLPDNFADLVVASAIERVKAEGGDPSHPLMIADRTPVAILKKQNGFSPRTLGVAIAALAASLLVAAFLMRQPGTDPTDLIADNQADISVVDPTVVPDEQNQGAIGEGITSPMLAADKSTEDKVDVDEELQEPGDSMLADVETPSVDGGTTGSNMNREEGMTGEPSVGDVAVADANVTEATETKVEAPAVVRPLSMLLVVQVRQTESGRANNAFDVVTSSLKFELAESRPIDDQLAAAVERDVEGGNLESEQKVLLLESPAKKLDQLINALAMNRAGIESVSFSLLHAQHDAPILKAVNAVRLPDPTKIRHEGLGIPLVSADPESDAFGLFQAGIADRDFAPITPATAGMVSAMGMSQPVRLPSDAKPNGSSLNETPDQMANVLFLIR